MMKSICLIIVYFGKWPAWFNIYLETCRYNPTVDWLFFTDCDIPENASQNIKFFKMHVNDFSTLASKKLGLKINLKEDNSYKLVDFKPAYGIIFEDYLKNYDFWGHSDIDVVFGDIRRFITDHILDTYDVITAKKSYLVGHFTIYKNCDKINRLYEKAAGYKRVFLYTERWYNFTECSKDWSYFVQGSSILNKKPLRKIIQNFILRSVNRVSELLGLKINFWVIREVESMTECVKRLEKDSYLKSFFETIGRGYGLEHEMENKWKLYWRNGKLEEIYTDNEMMYFHFVRLKSDKKFIMPDWHKIPEQFFITKEGFSEE